MFWVRILVRITVSNPKFRNPELSAKIQSFSKFLLPKENKFQIALLCLSDQFPINPLIYANFWVHQAKVCAPHPKNLPFPKACPQVDWRTPQAFPGEFYCLKGRWVHHQQGICHKPVVIHTHKKGKQLGHQKFRSQVNLSVRPNPPPLLPQLFRLGFQSVCASANANANHKSGGILAGEAFIAWTPKTHLLFTFTFI